MGLKLVHVILHEAALPHIHVHRRGKEDGYRGSHDHGGKEIVCDAVGDLAQDVCRGRGDYHEIGDISQGYVTDLGAPQKLEHVAEDRVAREGLKGEGGDELLGVFGHHHMDVRPSSAHFTEELYRLVGGNPPTHTQYDFFVFQHPRVFLHDYYRIEEKMSSFEASFPLTFPRGGL